VIGFWDRRWFSELRFHTYLKADLRQASQEAAGAALRVQTIVMVAADFAIDHAFVVDDVPGDGEYPIRDCHGRLLSAAPRRHPPEERRQEAIFLVRDGPSALR